MGRLWPYNEPCINNVIGIIASMIQGSIMPIFAIFMSKMLFSLMNPNKIVMWEGAVKWCTYMVICAATSFVTGVFQKLMFGIVGENLTKNIRSTLYLSLVKKDIGWFDYADNAPGVLTNLLATDVQLINGASTEGLGSQLEAFFSLIIGIGIGFIFSWKVALVCFGMMPVLVIGAMINGKMQTGV
jgi:ABC-type multidrug transport system fused ATPase/permease subunit